MSRIGKLVIAIPKNVEVQISAAQVQVKGPKGTLRCDIHPSMKLEKNETNLHVVPVNAEQYESKYQGLVRSLVNNMVQGVVQGFSKSLILRGVGYRALVKGQELQLTLGYSHQVLYPIPTGIQIQVDKLGNDPLIVVSGADKELVGQAAANIRSYRRPEPYHGKGVRYVNEVIITKVGKSAGKK